MPQTTKSSFKPNFFHKYSVLIDHSIDEVFPVLGTVEGHERVCRLWSSCSQVGLLQKDLVSIPEASSLSQNHVRTLPSAGEQDVHGRKLHRQFFSMEESIPVLCGLYNHQVHLLGTLTWDESAKTTLYESESSAGIQVWKLREFAVEGNKTRVTERIEGVCSFLLKPIVQKEAAKGHAEHMESYRSLFSSP
ncbi:hypothetical protein E1B28_011052 [Marasmius oreades]|uniref:Uncharacterized protein n=1 Tax=Marasmius oreades TaxID=181124 RepID=A0A9P7RTT5_9AGAR|nr:uncharacterized protein E1B28_011052 [Marasmius oreades]KAG7089362.1 hypothetical protein E1B28_011052 [Marasmius oreades]